jgi:hypothetical protein
MTWVGFILQRQSSLAIFCLLISALAVQVVALATTPNNSNSQDKPLQGYVSASDLCFDLDSRFGVTARASNSKQFKATIEGVRPGSLAFFNGLRAGDKILTASVSADRLDITIDRGGHTYGITLHPRKPLPDNQRPPSLSSGTPAPNLTGKTPDAGKPKLDSPDVAESKLLAAHDVYLILDCSGSMATPDCPAGLSRWEWCQNQMLKLMQDTEGYLQDINLLVFNYAFDKHPHCNMQQITNICSSRTPDGGTDTYSPLRDVIEAYFARNNSRSGAKPLLVAVITDGLPNLPDGPENAQLSIRDEILSAIKRMNRPDDITITFIQVGPIHSFIDELSNEAYSIVHTNSFSELQNTGLKKCLITALTANSHSTRKPTVIDNEMERIKNELIRIHQRKKDQNDKDQQNN